MHNRLQKMFLVVRLGRIRRLKRVWLLIIGLRGCYGNVELSSEVGHKHSGRQLTFPTCHSPESLARQHDADQLPRRWFA